MSANAPCKQSSRTARIVEVHPAPQVADEDNDPTMDRDPVAPVGGPPGDDGPGGDPGDDDPNDLSNDNEDNDNEVEDLSRPVLPDQELTKGGSAITSGCQQCARAMKLRYITWWWQSHERKLTGFGNGFGRCLVSVSTSRRESE